jgi:hypothetical protein
MNLDKTQAAEILSLTEDELMFLQQSGRIQAGVDQDTLAWQFKLDDVLKLKAAIEEQIEEE